MPYHLGSSSETQLRVVHKYVSHQVYRGALAKARLIVLEHILPTTEEFLRLLMRAGAEIFAVIAKPYSINADVLKRLKARHLNVLEHPYAELEATGLLDSLLVDAVALSQKDNKQIVILEVGGYFAGPLTRVDPAAPQFIAGVVEDTTFGHNRYQALLPDIPVPVFSVARSALKEIEARFVGRDAVTSVEHVLRDLGVCIAGRNALVIGYGMIGKNVARALRHQDLNVAVYDKHDYRNLRAYVDGFAIHKKRELIKSADVIFAATADRALLWDEIEECRNHVILASVGSKDTEFDVSTLQEQSVSATRIHPHLMEYTTSNSKRVVVVKEGTAVNFILPSIPVEILDLVFGEILLCAILLLKRQAQYVHGVLHQAPETYLNRISKDWLRSVNIP